MDGVINQITATRIGRLAFKSVRPLLHFARHMAHPDIPTHQKITNVSFRGRHFAIVHRRNFPDSCVIDQCFTQAQYDMPVGAHGVLIEGIYNQIVSAGKQPLIIDCGANIGASVLWFIARYPSAHIVAVEPAPDNFSLLKRNTTGLDVDLVQAGIAADDGLAHLSDPGKGEYGYRTTQADDGPEVAMVSIRTLLTTKPISHYTPFLLKMDIEGAEKPLFEGDTTELNRFPLIIMEPHDWLLPGQNSSRPFFHFHAAAGREFCMKHENIASITAHASLLEMTTGLKN
jgi:FkbM family methyltransferase